MNTIKLNVIGELTSSTEGGSGGGGGCGTPQLPIGVYIYTTDGFFCKADQWDSANNDKAVGVFMNDGEHNFVIAPEDSMYNSKSMGGYGIIIEGICTTTQKDEALLDFNGQDNTNKIINQLKETSDSKDIVGSPACEACANYIFRNGARGYLPALGELSFIILNYKEIGAAMMAIGNRNFGPNPSWSSTQTNGEYAWRGWLGGDINAWGEKYNKSAHVICGKL